MTYPGRSAGVLGPRYERWGVDLAPVCMAPDTAGSCPNCFSHDDPNDPARAPGKGPNAWWDNSSCRKPDFHLPDLGRVDVSIAQIENRSRLLASLDDFRRAAVRAEAAGCLDAWDAHRRQAMQLVLTSRPGRHNPFDLTQEPDRVRDRYGREEWGQGFLVARRLVEAGVRMVQINLRGWDTHQNAFRDLKGKLLPSIDHCLSGFLDDLEERGLLDETLVVMCGEMGRTPKVSPIAEGGKNRSGEIFSPGRHHWGDVFPCFFAGGGIQAGQIIGQSDRHGGVPVTEAFTPADLAATIFHLLGIPSGAEFHDSAGRPFRMTEGKPIAGLC
jgi:diadenosine tetraphosphatase ApaH/serine/threonine PP2A family protein phosphatase